MQKRIFFNFIGLVLACVALLVASFGLLFFNAVQRHEMAAIRDKVYLVADLLNQNAVTNYGAIDGGGTRITIISSEGWTLLDSHVGADADANRSDREEFIQAMAYGTGEAIRASATFGADTFYYAVRLHSGDILRLSRPLYGLSEAFTPTIPILALVTVIILAIAYLIAYRLTRIIIKPLIEIDFDKPTLRETPYEELWPYIKKIDNQRIEIASQLATLRNRAETIDAIIANMREGIVMLDEKGLILASNQSALNIFGISRTNEVLHKNIGYIYRDTEFMQAVKVCLDGTRTEINFTRNKRFFNAFLSPASSGAIIFILDVTDRHKADAQRREFTANVSHELKTPLTTIYAISEMMVNGMAKREDIEELSQKISSHAKRLMSIIDDILRLSEFDENKVEKDFTVFDVFGLAQTVTASLRDMASEKAVTIDLTGQPLQIKANNRLIDELLHNLIENGVKYNRNGGSVAVSVREEDGMCKISVADTGIGIPTMHHGRVFERFYRV
ncbi:MAG: ATP-binding protein, partial [Defluviitaleaceae bacterium]|nr:ATP-binding protein [Defluviitaleaceae bacterium]